VFAPVAAHLAAGAELADAGDPLAPEQLERLELPEPREEEGALVAHALICDRFGNVSLDVHHEHLQGSGLTLGAGVEVEVGDRRRLATYAQTFADVAPGELLVYEDAYRTLAIAVNRGDAAEMLGVDTDAEVRLRPA
jgi:S-adenosylmethionine hydrolase